MRNIYDSYSAEDYLRYAGNTENVNPVRRITIEEGRGKGLSFYDVRCIGGLDLLICIDRGLDILKTSYRGINVNFTSKNGITGKDNFNPHEDEFLRYFTGGMLTTCGLRNAGPSCRDESGEYHPLHGRYNMTCADNVSVRYADHNIIEISGTVRESSLFGANLSLFRTITVDALKSEISIRDVLSNDSSLPEEFMLLYHYNFGFPFLNEGCSIEFEKEDKVIPRTPEAKKGMGEYTKISAPVDGYNEQVFFHMQKGDENKTGKVRLFNPKENVIATLKYDTSVLPVLAQWKSMASGDYALGLEPSNNYIMGRVEERKNETLKTINPYSKIEFNTSLEFESEK